MKQVNRNYYELLGVPFDADGKTIKNAFRKLALHYHPDRNSSAEAEDRFKEIAEAYAVLSDPQKRAQYDAGDRAGVAGLSPEDMFGGIDFADLFRGQGFDFGLGGIGFADRFFSKRRQPHRPQRGSNIEEDVVVPLEMVLTGGEWIFEVKRPITCPTCNGSGAKPGTQRMPCVSCSGSGQKVRSRRDGPLTFQQISRCPACGGQGTMVAELCPICVGRGRVEANEQLTIDIPVGMEEGMVVRLAGCGHPSPGPHGTPGDMYVVLRTRPNPRFEREGIDLWREEVLDVPDAVLGTQLQVPTLEKPVSVSIPPGVQPDCVLRLKGKGLPDFGHSLRGDLYIKLNVRIPVALTPYERDLYERLRHPSEAPTHSPAPVEPSPPIEHTGAPGRLWRSIFERLRAIKQKRSR